jgi:pyruvate formate-lyase/glycerol dehydratase family glycyl radical enzyme
MSERTQELKKRMVWKGVVVKEIDSRGHIVPKMARAGKISLERARLVTQSYKATEGEPIAIRRAKSLAHVLENMTIYIDEGELIVGHHSPSSEELSICPEASLKSLTAALNDGYRGMLDEKEMEEYKEIAKYWAGKSAFDRILAVLPERLNDFLQYNGVAWLYNIESVIGATIHDIGKVFRIGLNGVIEQIKARLEEIEADDSLPVKEYLQQRNSLEAMLIAVQAVINWSKRYSALATELAAKEKDEKRKAELNKIAEVCDWVPANPSRTLHEAIQCYNTCLTVIKQIEQVDSGPLGHRLDVLLNPFYQKDKQEGRISREEAQELIECLFIKLCDWQWLRPPQNIQAMGGGQGVVKDLTIGGVTADGDDATNEVSFIILDAADSLRLPEPTIALRYHSRISPELISRATDVVKTGIGYPAFYNDTAYIPWLLSIGWPLEKSRDYGIGACVVGMPACENCQSSRQVAGVINLSACLELALYQGWDEYSGRQFGVKTPDLRKATSIEDIMDAYLQQVNYFIRQLAAVDKIREAINEEYMPVPFNSTLVNGCIEGGKDCQTWSFAGDGAFVFTGTTNIANSLAAIKKFVFEDKVITMEDLIEACRTNFEGKEELRQMLINKAPKFGNDDDYVDVLAKEVHVRSNAEVMKVQTRFGFPYFLNGAIAGGYFSATINTGALPDGKRRGEPCADAVVSPSAGTDKCGPSAVLKSVSKIPYTYMYLLNQKFLPNFLEGENKEKFSQYLKTWHELGIGHVQFNVVDKATLLDAQAHPEKYTNLIVRVAGYSAYFIDLAKALQDDIIRRVEQEF